MASIPSELIAAIVDELEDDRESLKACSTVAPPFCSPSQSHLFRSMWLHRENWHFYTGVQQALHRGTTIPSGTIKKVYSLLSESPHLAVYVRDLTIDLPDSTDEDKPLEHVLQVATNLERFVVSGLSLPWGDLSGPLSSTIVEVFARPTLQRLHLYNVYDVPESAVFRMLSFKTVLSIHHTIMASDEEEENAHKRYPPSQLEHLILSTSLPATYELVLSPRAPKFPRIKQLTVRLDRGARIHAERLFSSVADTLTHLELDCGELSVPLNLPHLPHLSSVTFRIFRGLARTQPDGLGRTLLGLPRVRLTMMYGIQSRLTEVDWAAEDPLVELDTAGGPTEGRDVWQTDGITCKLLFLGPTAHKASSTRGIAFTAFCAAMDAALPGFEIAYERVDEQLPYLERLP
ncbi:hypothetical protein C8R43DRAFT_357643 [Mycena crocata]|nr:hypothetical protein C8R43DRAFT_357643 [Mycena crocata]